MNNWKTSFITACTIAVANYSSGVYAQATEGCFKSKMDYEVYQIYGDSPPQIPHPDNIPHPEFFFGLQKMQKMREAVEHGPAQRKPIIIDVKDSQADGMMYLDASGSKTPSGQILYAWGNETTFSTESKASSRVRDPGVTVSMKLTVKDPVCESTASTIATATVK